MRSFVNCFFKINIFYKDMSYLFNPLIYKYKVTAFFLIMQVF